MPAIAHFGSANLSHQPTWQHGYARPIAPAVTCVTPGWATARARGVYSADAEHVETRFGDDIGRPWLRRCCSRRSAGNGRWLTLLHQAPRRLTRRRPRE